MACHVSTCMALCHAYIRGSHGLLVEKGELKISPWEQQGEEEGREGEGGGKEQRKGGKERRKGGKERRKERREEKKKEEEERKKKEGEEGVLRSEQARKAKNPELRYKRYVGFLLHWLFYA